MVLIDVAIQVGVFILVVILFSLASPIFMRWMFRFYDRLETYHPVEEEGFKTKTYKLWFYNAVTSTFATGIAVLYEPFLSGLGVPFSLETIVASAVLISVTNFAIRITSYSYFEDPDIPVVRLKEDAHNAGYSLMVSIWILLFLGFGLMVANGQVSWTYSLPSVSIPHGLLYAVVIIITPGVLAYISEKWLYEHATIPEELQDDYV